MMFKQFIAASIAATCMAVAAPVQAQAKPDPHRAEDQGKHQKIAAAHAAAAACLQAPNASREACHAQLQADCKGLAIGTHCGLRSKPDEHQDVGKHIVEHQRMATVHTAAAQCLGSERPYKGCLAEMTQACTGLGVGKYCGMRHAH
jgi:hypothetical protein